MSHSNIKPYTLFLDIDGTLIKHAGRLSDMPRHYNKDVLLDKTLEKLEEWNLQGHHIILTTGRPESYRNKTEEQLVNLGIFYDQLIMGIGGGKRYIINDLKPDGTKTCEAINLVRDEGIGNIQIL